MKRKCNVSSCVGEALEGDVLCAKCAAARGVFNEVVKDLELEERKQIEEGLGTLKRIARQIWGSENLHSLEEIVIRTQVTLGDLARLSRDDPFAEFGAGVPPPDQLKAYHDEVKKELGNLVLSTIRFMDDLSYDPVACLDLARAAQERFARKRPPGRR